MNKRQPIEIFMPPNILKAKLGGRGHGIDAATVRRAETAIEEIKTEFTDWISDDIEMLAVACDKYLKNNDGQAFSRLFRASHDLKGQAATFEYPLIARISASLCTLLETRGVAEGVCRKLTAAHVNAVRAIFHARIKTMSDREALELVEELERQVQAVAERSAAKS
jgi:chemotaxis protein histidine kinase CheA